MFGIHIFLKHELFAFLYAFIPRGDILPNGRYFAAIDNRSPRDLLGLILIIVDADA